MLVEYSVSTASSLRPPSRPPAPKNAKGARQIQITRTVGSRVTTTSTNPRLIQFEDRAQSRHHARGGSARKASCLNQAGTQS